MDNIKLVRRWQQKIICRCEEKPGRPLTETEHLFIESRGGFMALEIIENTVEDLSKENLSSYLNSE